MLPKQNRLSNQEDFDLVKASGESYRSSSFIFNYRFRKNTFPTRIGFIVTKKIDSRATERNRVIRKLRNSIRPHIENLVDGYDCVVVALFSIKDKSLAEVEDEMKNVLIKIKLIQK